MFDRTIHMLEKCKEDARAFAFFSTLITQSFFILYYICALALSLGHPIVYSILLALTTTALLFLIFTENHRCIKPIKIRRWVRISIRYAKYCVHLVAISLTLYTFYMDPQKVSPITLVLLILAILAFLIQIIGEITGFLSRRYFEELLAAALADTALLRSLLDKVQSGADTLHRMKDDISAFPGRAAEKAGQWSAGIKEKLSVFKRKKKEPPLLADIVVEADEISDEQNPDTYS